MLSGCCHISCNLWVVGQVQDENNDCEQYCGNRLESRLILNVAFCMLLGTLRRLSEFKDLDGNIFVLNTWLYKLLQMTRVL